MTNVLIMSRANSVALALKRVGKNDAWDQRTVPRGQIREISKTKRKIDARPMNHLVNKRKSM